MSTSVVEQLALAQLQAYNQSDLDAFCACYHPQVQILDEAGAVTIQGLDSFRERYVDLFSRYQFGATVSQRLVLNQTCIDDESWWRIDPDTGSRSEGRVLVRYQEKGGKIALVQFLP